MKIHIELPDRIIELQETSNPLGNAFKDKSDLAHYECYCSAAREKNKKCIIINFQMQNYVNAGGQTIYSCFFDADDVNECKKYGKIDDEREVGSLFHYWHNEVDFQASLEWDARMLAEFQKRRSHVANRLLHYISCDIDELDELEFESLFENGFDDSVLTHMQLWSVKPELDDEIYTTFGCLFKRVISKIEQNGTSQQNELVRDCQIVKLDEQDRGLKLALGKRSKNARGAGEFYF